MCSSSPDANRVRRSNDEGRGDTGGGEVRVQERTWENARLVVVKMFSSGLRRYAPAQSSFPNFVIDGVGNAGFLPNDFDGEALLSFEALDHSRWTQPCARETLDRA